MEIKVITGEFLRRATDLAVFACFEDAPLAEEVSALLEPADFKGRANQVMLLYPRAP